MALKPGASLGVGDQAERSVWLRVVVLCLVSAEDTLESHDSGRVMNCIGSCRSRFCYRLQGHLSHLKGGGW
jgi:hypothetical protein